MHTRQICFFHHLQQHVDVLSKVSTMSQKSCAQDVCCVLLVVRALGIYRFISRRLTLEIFVSGRIGMLEECIFYLKQSIALVSDPKFYKSKRISMRNKRLNQECKLKLQLCAILSQN